MFLKKKNCRTHAHMHTHTLTNRIRVSTGFSLMIESRNRMFDTIVLQNVDQQLKNAKWNQIKCLLQCCSVSLLPSQPLAGGKTWLWWRRGRKRLGGGGGEAGELHGDAGQHLHGGQQPGGAQICQGDFNSQTAV